MSNQERVIGIIGGTGWLGAAIVKAILQSPDFSHTRLIVSYRTHAPTKVSPRVTITQDNQFLAEASDIVVLSVRPQDCSTIDINLENKLLISVMAGITASHISKKFNTPNVIRSLPNAAASVNESYTPWFASKSCSKNELAYTSKLFSTFGSEDKCETEDEIDYLTAVSGAGPAYPALLAQALEESALKHGLPQNIARRAANAVIRGSGSLLEDIHSSPKELVNVFENYKGTTASGLVTMRNAGFIEAVDKGINAAYQRAKILGQ